MEGQSCAVWSAGHAPHRRTWTRRHKVGTAVADANARSVAPAVAGTPAPADPPGPRAATQLLQVLPPDDPGGDQSQSGQEAQLRLQCLCPANTVETGGQVVRCVGVDFTSLDLITAHTEGFVGKFDTKQYGTYSPTIGAVV